MKRPGKKVATDRSFVVALSRGLDVLRAFHPNDGLLGNQEIAARLFVAVKTVETYRARISEKLHLRSRNEMTRYALAAGLLTIEDALQNDDSAA